VKGIPQGVVNYIAAEGHGYITEISSTGGGCINDGRVLTTDTGWRAFLKTNPAAPEGMFAREAEGLSALANALGGPRVPATYAVSHDFLLLEYLAPTRPSDDYWRKLGMRLAHVHDQTSPKFGFANDNYLGSTPQPNTWRDDGHAFFSEQRLLFQARRAAEAALLPAACRRRAERMAGRLRDLVPAQPASLLHGDLWAGNIIPGPDGEACLIDPAVYFGWAEADLAMTALFGQPPQALYDAYTATRTLEPGYRGRFEVYNLYHLLNHLNLFGISYLGAVEATLRRFG
jgi:protein-ribulosamine 3-kinase